MCDNHGGCFCHVQCCSTIMLSCAEQHNCPVLLSITKTVLRLHLHCLYISRSWVTSQTLWTTSRTKPFGAMFLMHIDKCFCLRFMLEREELASHITGRRCDHGHSSSSVIVTRIVITAINDYMAANCAGRPEGAERRRPGVQVLRAPVRHCMEQRARFICRHLQCWLHH